MTRSRTIGDPTRQEAVQHLVHALQRAGAQVTVDAFEAALTSSTGEPERRYPLTNIYARLRPEKTPAFILATHFDTRPWADEEPDPALHAEPVPGANDGSSGVAVLLELIPVLEAQLPAEVGYAVFLFDGEELGRPGHGGYCAGSRRLAAQFDHGETPDPWLAAIIDHAELGIVLDMVGDRDLDLRMETFSREAHPELLKAIWGTATDLGITAFQSAEGRRILDDHVFLTQAGVPSVLLIDDRYPYWHTRADTLDKVSAASLGAVGEVVRRTLLAVFSGQTRLRGQGNRGNGR